MWMWVFILLFMAALSLIGLGTVAEKISRFSFLRRLGIKKARIIGISAELILMAILCLWSTLWNAMIFFIHLLLIWLLTDGLVWLAEKVGKRTLPKDAAGIIAIAATVCYLLYGVFSLHHVSRTAYTVDVEGGPARIVGFSDSHVGTTFRGKDLIKYVEAMNREKADLVVIVGDFVDDDTSYEDMLDACAALGQLEAKTYYVFGNHDCGYYNSRGYGKTELVQQLEASGVTVLEDEAVEAAQGVILLGRADASNPGRRSMAELTAGLPRDKCLVVLDHQPNDYAAEEAAGADLVISGHTHGGQFFPILRAGEWIGANDMTYGLAKSGRTNFIVSSGISNWAFQIKTGCISEYLVIDLATVQAK